MPRRVSQLFPDAGPIPASGAARQVPADFRIVLRETGTPSPLSSPRPGASTGLRPGSSTRRAGRRRRGCATGRGRSRPRRRRRRRRGCRCGRARRPRRAATSAPSTDIRHAAPFGSARSAVSSTGWRASCGPPARPCGRNPSPRPERAVEMVEHRVGAAAHGDAPALRQRLLDQPGQRRLERRPRQVVEEGRPHQPPISSRSGRAPAGRASSRPSPSRPWARAARPWRGTPPGDVDVAPGRAVLDEARGTAPR